MNLSRICFPAANKDSIEATNLVEWNMAAIMWFIWRLFETLGSTQVAWLHAYLLKGRSICKVTCSVDSSWDLRKKKSSILKGNLDLLMRYKVGNGHQIDQYIYIHTHTIYFPGMTIDIRKTLFSKILVLELSVTLPLTIRHQLNCLISKLDAWERKSGCLYKQYKLL